MPDPLPVSVVVPVRDRADDLRRCLERIGRQTARPLEVIVVDDASSDDSAAVADAFGARVFRNAAPLGPAMARNRAIAEARGGWVALCDSDDEWLPRHLETLWAHSAGQALVATAALQCGGGRVVYAGVMGRRPVRLGDPSRFFFPGGLLTTSATMLNTDRLREIGAFPDRFWAEDLLCFASMLGGGRTAVLIPTVTVVYAVHEAQMTNDVRPTLIGHLEVTRLHRAEPWYSHRLEQRVIGRVRWDALRQASRRGDDADVRRQIRGLVACRARLTGAGLYLLRRRVIPLYTRGLLAVRPSLRAAVKRAAPTQPSHRANAC
jgi:glycosyltransferase involved in cell wall biosynthesis